MTYRDLDEGRRLHAELKDVFSRQRGGWADKEALRKVADLCRAASAAVDDAYCRETLGIVGDYAAQVFSDRRHQSWDQGSMSGADFLRLQILHALDSLHSRLYSLEVIRRAGEFNPYLRWPSARGEGDDRGL
jgi:transposase InsO family protein